MTINQILLEAIALKKCVTAVYNRTPVKLAPHILYGQDQRLFVDAVTVERGGQPPREIKFGTFQLTGLREVGIGDETFERDPSFDAKAEKYEGQTLFAVD